jgi:hypothetical protein
MRKYLLIHSLLLVMALGEACSPVRVLNTEADQNFSLANYRTFGFMEVNAEEGTSGLAISPESLAIFQREVAKQLQQRGLTQSASSPDLQINLGMVVMEKTQTRETNIRTDPPYYMGQRRYTWQSKEVEVGRYKEGTISVHLVDRAQNTLVWSGEAESVVPKNQEKVEERISEGVEKLFLSIPVAGK